MRRLVAAVALLAGCASMPTRPDDQPQIAAADASVRDGCYLCLLEARETFETLAVTAARPDVIVRLFETEVLIGLRLAELALSPDEALARAERLAPELPFETDADFLLQLARAIPPDRLGTPRVIMRQSARERRTFAADTLPNVFVRLDASTASVPFLNYLSASLACLAAEVGIRATDTVAIPPDAPPLVRYRLATCPTPRVDELESVQRDVPGFVEAGFFRARIPAPAMTVAHVAEQRAALTAAAEQFPRSPAVLYSTAALHQTLGDCRTALSTYDVLLAVSPDHEDGALQRIVCLGYLGQHDDAIGAATRLINERFDNMSEAYYWRAWNYHTLKQLDEARADIDRALGLRVNARVLSLSGMIKYDQREFPAADRDLRRAVEMDSGQCVARWYLGLVAFEGDDWHRTGQEFEAASACYERSVERTERDLQRMRDADLDPQFKASQTAGFEAVLAEDRGQEHASAVNAAIGYVRAAYADKARVMLSRIPRDSMHAAAAAELSRYLDAIVGPVPADASTPQGAR